MKESSSETEAAQVTAELMDWFIDSGITKITKIKLEVSAGDGQKPDEVLCLPKVGFGTFLLNT